MNSGFYRMKVNLTRNIELLTHDINATINKNGSKIVMHVWIFF